MSLSRTDKAISDCEARLQKPLDPKRRFIVALAVLASAELETAADADECRAALVTEAEAAGALVVEALADRATASMRVRDSEGEHKVEIGPMRASEGVEPGVMIAAVRDGDITKGTFTSRRLARSKIHELLSTEQRDTLLRWLAQAHDEIPLGCVLFDTTLDVWRPILA